MNRRERILNVLNEVNIKLTRTSEPISHLTGEVTVNVKNIIGMSGKKR